MVIEGASGTIQPVGYQSHRQLILLPLDQNLSSVGVETIDYSRCDYGFATRNQCVIIERLPLEQDYW